MSARTQRFGFVVVIGILVLAVAMLITACSEADAHTGSPTMPTFSGGQVLTHTQVNDAFAHLHNTLTGGITNSHISSSAAIAHTKLLMPALVPKAWAVVIPACAGGAAAGTLCTVASSSQVTSITAHGTTGVYRVNLAYTPPSANFATIVTNHTGGGIFCTTDTMATVAPHFRVNCLRHDNVAVDATFSVIVMGQ